MDLLFNDSPIGLCGFVLLCITECRSSFAIILTRKRAGCFTLFSSRCLVNVSILRLQVPHGVVG